MRETAAQRTNRLRATLAEAHARAWALARGIDIQ
jgi:hypothetical protein